MKVFKIDESNVISIQLINKIANTVGCFGVLVQTQEKTNGRDIFDFPPHLHSMNFLPGSPILTRITGHSDEIQIPKIVQQNL